MLFNSTFLLEINKTELFKSIFDNFKTQLLFFFSNTYIQLTEPLNYNQLSKLIAMEENQL
jgi:hypothetical protein